MSIVVAPRRSSIRRILLCTISMVVLTSGFMKNLWRVADADWFANFQRDSESAILGRLVESRQFGILSDGGLLGRGGSPGRGGFDYQFIAYSRGLAFTNYSPYLSQTGGQGMLFGLLDSAIPLGPGSNLRLFRLLTSLLTALALTMIIIWSDAEFGVSAGIFVMGAGLVSQWLVVIGRNLWWSTWAFFIPVLAIGLCAMRAEGRGGNRVTVFGFVAFIAVLAKVFINGFEFITPTLVMMLLPLLYYAISRESDWRLCLAHSFSASLGAVLAILLGLLLLAIQVGSLGGGIQAGAREILTSLLKRTYGDPLVLDPVYTSSLQASPFFVLSQYALGVFFDPGQWIARLFRSAAHLSVPLRYYHLILILLGASAGVVWLSRRAKEPVRLNRRALVITAWASILAPLSWFLIFKAHAAAHYHLDFIVWQMPFTFFVFAVAAVCLRDAVLEARSRLANRRTYVGPPGQGPS